MFLKTRELARYTCRVCFGLSTALAFLTASGNGVSTQPVVDCPMYVAEGADLVCECNSPRHNMEDAKITWPLYSHSKHLQVHQVSRRDNNKQFTCRMTWMKTNSTAVYTLRVAYGPSNNTMRIDGPGVFITNGSQTLVLRCIADEVNPKPLITWHSDPCNKHAKNDSCTFKPMPPKHDGKEIRCRAINPSIASITAGTASYVLYLTYPPLDAPVIHGHDTGQIHKVGDKLTCTVSGGKPKVSKVVFICSNPVYKDEPDLIETSSVSSSITVSSCEPADYETVCTCSTVWEPDPRVYTRTASVTFAVRQCDRDNDTAVTVGTTTTALSEGEHNSSLFERSEEIVIVTIVPVCTVLIIIGVLIFARKCGLIDAFKRRRTQRTHRNETDDENEEDLLPTPRPATEGPQDIVTVRETDEESTSPLMLPVQHDDFPTPSGSTEPSSSVTAVAIPAGALSLDHPLPLSVQRSLMMYGVAQQLRDLIGQSETVSGVPMGTLTRHIREFHPRPQSVVLPIDDRSRKIQYEPTYEWPEPIEHKSYVVDTIEALEGKYGNKKDTKRKKPFGSDRK